VTFAALLCCYWGCQRTSFAETSQGNGAKMLAI
jgi:hypothetical protein